MSVEAPRHEKALSWDLDGVLVRRIPFQASALRKMFTRRPIDTSPIEIPEIDRTTPPPHHFLKERWDFMRHSMPINANVARLVPDLAQSYDNYVNSGRISNVDWDAKSKGDLEKSGILKYFNGFYFKPEGTKGILSKAAAIRELLESYGPDNVTHIDDNAQEVIRLAKLFPTVNFIILQDLSSGILVNREELKNYPNVRREARLRNGLRDFEETNETIDSNITRNSKFRALTSLPFRLTTKIIHKSFPWLKPDHITLAGVIGTTIGATLAATRTDENSQINRDLTKKAATFLVISAALDRFDGELARLINSENPNSIDTEVSGQIKDALSDRAQELVIALMSALVAYKRDGLSSVIGKYAALAKAATNSLPSVAKAYAETNGNVVPETGSNPLSFLGTRAGRVGTGIPATIVHQTQPTLDIIATLANLASTAERLKIASDPLTTTLPEKTRFNSLNRLKYLAAFSAFALAVTALTHQLLKTEKSPVVRNLQKEQEAYLKTIAEVENYCRENDLDHRMVGGTLTDFIGPQTEFDIDCQNRRIRLLNSSNTSLIRTDGSVKDVDIVVFTNDYQKITRACEVFEMRQQVAQQNGEKYPQISLEAAYQPDWPKKRNHFKQMVSAFEVNGNGELSLAFGQTKHEITPDSVEPWIIDIDGQQEITTFNPVAHRLCYELRVPSGIKPKDKEKMPILEILANKVIEAGLIRGIDYRLTYVSWWAYIQNLENDPDFLTWVKSKIIIGPYWRYFGETIAHGKGPLGFLARYSSKMNG